MKEMLAAMSLALCAACSGSAANPSPQTANDAAAPGPSLAAGTKVCISDLAGVRYTLEDALVAEHLKPTGNCEAAKVRLSESGQPKAWIMRYQRVGDAKWKECRSSEQDRGAFAEQCIERMVSDLGG